MVSTNGIDGVAWLNGNIVDPSEASIPLMSAAVFRGTSVFDVMSVVRAGDGLLAVGLVPHLERLVASAQEMGMASPFDIDTLRGAVGMVLDGWTDAAVVRTVIADAGGSGAGGTPEPMVAMTAESAGERPDRPLHMASARVKIDPAVLPPGVKVAASYAPGLRVEARLSSSGGNGIDGIINFAPDGTLLEAVSASVGVVVDGVVILPSLDRVLDSITRRLVIDVCDTIGVGVEIGSLSRAQVLDADEIFLASSTRFVVPVASLDGVPIGDPTRGGASNESAGAVVGRLRAAIEAVLAADHPLSARWLTPVGGDVERSGRER